MSDFHFTLSQKRRLIELGADSCINLTFNNEKERDSVYDNLDTEWQRKNREALLNLLKNTKRPFVRRLESKLIEALISNGFVEVTTPIIISSAFIEQMGISNAHHLWKQIFGLKAGDALDLCLLLIFTTL